MGSRNLLNRKKQAIVHQLELSHELRVHFYHFVDALNILLLEPKEVNTVTMQLLLNPLQIHIFQRARFLNFWSHSNISVNNRTLKIKDILDPVRIVVLDCIGH